MSKNPPLTEDQIRQSAEAEAWYAAAQASRNSQLDYMIAEQRQQQAAAALEAIWPDLSPYAHARAKSARAMGCMGNPPGDSFSTILDWSPRHDTADVSPFIQHFSQCLISHGSELGNINLPVLIREHIERALSRRRPRWE